MVARSAEPVLVQVGINYGMRAIDNKPRLWKKSTPHTSRKNGQEIRAAGPPYPGTWGFQEKGPIQDTQRQPLGLASNSRERTSSACRYPVET